MNTENEKSRGPIPWKITIWVILLAGLSVALADLLVGASRLTRAAVDFRQSWSNYWSPPQEKMKSFEALGGRVRVGCENSQSTSVPFVVPEGAYEVQARCAWVDTEKLKKQSCEPRVEGNTAIANGSIKGRDKEWGNCDGGGHGSLKLSGTYKIKE